VLVTLAAVSVIGTIGFATYQGVREQAAARKLEQDVKVINNAIDSYLASGGAIAGSSTAVSVIGQLKTSADAASAAATLGLKGSFLDARVRPVFRAEVADAPEIGANYNAAERRFVLTEGGDIVAFAFDEAAAAAASVTSEARAPALAQATEGKGWVWDYAELAASSDAPTGEFATGDPEDDGGGGTFAGQLETPVITGSPLGTTLDTFPKTVEIANPNAGVPSRLYYSLDGTKYRLYSGAFAVNPETTVFAVVVTLDPSRYANSGVASKAFAVDPFQLAIALDAPTSVTYAQAGGYFLNNQPPRQSPLSFDIDLDVSLSSTYVRSEYFEVRYTLDGSEPNESSLLGQPSFNGAFTFDAVALDYTNASWGANSLVIKAYARAKNNWFLSSPVVTNIVSIEKTPLAVDVVPANPVGLPPTVRMSLSSPVPTPSGPGSVPTFFYRIDGQVPLETEGSASIAPTPAGSAVTASIASPSSSSYNFAVQATVTGFEKWFESPVTERSYNTVTVLNPDFVGANISGGDVNGSLTGSIFVAAPANLGIFNAGGTITRGNLYLPGLPEIEITGQGNRGTTIVAQGAFYSGTPPIARSIIAGKEYSADGQLADPQLDTRQIVDLSGITYTNPYTVKITTSTFIEGKVYRNVDVPTNTVAVPNIGVTNRVTGSLTGLPPQTLAAGVYSNNINMNNTNAVLRLGVSGATNVTQYVFSGNTWSKGKVEILSPVQIFYTTGFVNSGVVFGATNTVNNLKIYVTAANGDVDIRSGGAIYGSLWVTNAANPANRNDVIVGNGAIIVGSITAEYLNVAPGGVVNVE